MVDMGEEWRRIQAGEYNGHADTLKEVAKIANVPLEDVVCVFAAFEEVAIRKSRERIAKRNSNVDSN